MNRSRPAHILLGIRSTRPFPRIPSALVQEASSLGSITSTGPRSLHRQWGPSVLSCHRSFITSWFGKRSPQLPDNESTKPSSSTSDNVFDIASLVRTSDAISANLALANRAYTSLAQTATGRLMRLDKPTGTYLLFFPAAWAIAAGATSFTQGVCLTSLFFAGSVLMRGAGCTVNDIWDRDVDRQVERTKNRPLASGEVTLSYAGGLLISQLAGSLWVLTKLNEQCFLVAALSLVPVLFYPLAKRTFKYPQLVLGLTFNASSLVGYTAATATLASPIPLVLYTAACSWTMAYDTIYAFQDVKDDRKIGVQSTAIAFQDFPKLTVAAFAASKYAFLLAAGPLAELSVPYYMLLSVAASHEARHIANTDLEDPAQCEQAFDSNVAAGALTWLGFVLGRLF